MEETSSHMHISVVCVSQCIAVSPSSEKKRCVLRLTCTRCFCAQATIPGFRKGKAPANIVLNHFGKKSVTAEACEEIISASVPMALQQKDIRVSCDCMTGIPIVTSRITGASVLTHLQLIVSYLDPGPGIPHRGKGKKRNISLQPKEAECVPPLTSSKTKLRRTLLRVHVCSYGFVCSSGDWTGEDGG
jgi:hypothetical protein